MGRINFKLIAWVFVTIAVSGCGSPQEKTAGVSQAVNPVPNHAVTPMSTLPNGSPSSQANVSNFDPNVLTALKGDYIGTVEGVNLNNDSFSQSYTLHMDQTTLASNGMNLNFLYVNFRSSSSTIAISFDSYVQPVLIGWAPNGQPIYSFTTSVMTLNSVSPYPVAVEIILSLRGNQFDPTQSAIFIKDCGFSQGVACPSNLQDVWFGNDLRKRN